MNIKRFALGVALAGVVGFSGIQASSASSFASLGFDDAAVLNGTAIFYSTLKNASKFYASLTTFFDGHGFNTTVKDFVRFVDLETNSGFTKADLFSGASVWKDPGSHWHGILSFDKLDKTITFTSYNPRKNETVGGTLGVPGPIAGAGLPIVVALAGGFLALRRRSAA